MVINFNDFISNLVLENLHPELEHIIKSDVKSKQTHLAKKIKELTARGEKTGIEGNMPKGSSRAYLKHEEPDDVTIDGKKHKLQVGTKVAIKAQLDAHHDKDKHDGLSLGQMQNRAENHDHWVNSNYRILTKNHETGHFHTNHHSGIFPPLIDHDENHHDWTKVGHIRDVKAPEFKSLTKTESHPKGITHKDFCESMNRHHERNNGKYWEGSKEHEAHLDHVDSHPLVQKFQDYHGNTGHPPYDYQQIKNMGVFEHPNGTKHIVARDHGFDTEVSEAYRTARKNQFRRVMN